MPVTLANDLISWTLNDKGHTIDLRWRGFESHRLSAKYCYACGLKRGSEIEAPLKVTCDAERLIFDFPNGANVTIFVTPEGDYFTANVANVPEGSHVLFPVIWLQSSGEFVSQSTSCIMHDGELAACTRAFDTRNDRWTLSANGLFGQEHYEDESACAFSVCDYSGLRDVLRRVVRDEENEIGWSPLGGPFSQARYDELFAMRPLPGNMQWWIDLALASGCKMIHFPLISTYEHCGHYTPNPDWYPRGYGDVADCVAAIHDAGLLAMLHTMSGGIGKDDQMASDFGLWQNGGKPWVHYGTYQAGPQMFDRLGRAIAHVIDCCDFDGLYLDGLEALHAAPGVQDAWRLCADLGLAIIQAIDRPVYVETSNWARQLWPHLSRIGVFDAPERNYRADCHFHASANDALRDSMLPAVMGWKEIAGGKGITAEDVMRYARTAREHGQPLSWRVFAPDDPRHHPLTVDRISIAGRLAGITS